MPKSIAKRVAALLVVTLLATGCGSGNGDPLQRGPLFPEPAATGASPRPRRNVGVRG